MKNKRTIRALLALCLLLSACGNRNAAAPRTLSGTAAYTAGELPCELPFNELTAACAAGDALYLAGTVEEEEEPGWDQAPGGEEDPSGGVSFSSSFSTSGDGETVFTFGGLGRPALYRLDPASGAATRLEDYAPEDGAAVAALAPGGDGSLWALEQTFGGPDALDFSGGGAVAVNLFDDTPASQVWRRLDGNSGRELERLDVAELSGRDLAGITDTAADAAGRLYLAAGSSLAAVDGGGNALFTRKVQESVERLVPLPDGTVGALASDEAGTALYPIDPETGNFGGACPITGSVRRLYPGSGDFAFLYTVGDSLYGWRAGASAPERLLSWSGAGLDCGQVYALCCLSGGKIAVLLRDTGSWPMTCRLTLLSPAGEDELAERTVLTLATLGLDSETRARVLEFNRTSGQYRIEIRDYSEYGDGALTKLNTEIMAGKMPDLLDLSGDVPLRRYANKGLLADLWPFIESDPALGREGVMERVLRAAETDGRLYRVFSGFSIETAAGAPAAVGDGTGWTVGELRSALERQGPGCSVLGPGDTRDSLFETLFSGGLDRFVDWETGTARFDSPEFLELLEFCGSFPARARDGGGDYPDAYARVARGEQLLLPVYVSDLLEIQLYRALFGGSVSFVGYPGGSGARFHVEGGLALSASCKDQEGAWTFLRQVLLPGDTDFFGFFPVNRSDFERMVKESMEVTYLKDETGALITGADGEPIPEGVSYAIVDGVPIMLKPATQEDYDQAMALYEAAEGLSGRDETVWSIVRECAGSFFAGDRSAEDAGKLARNRVELYLNEQR